MNAALAVAFLGGVALAVVVVVVVAVVVAVFFTRQIVQARVCFSAEQTECDPRHS